jgi:hypothetical protein
MNLAQSRARLVNQLNALLRDLLAGGAPTDLSATTAAALLRRVRPSGDADRVRKQIATGLIGQIRSVDALLKSNARQVSELVAASGSTLTAGVGAITSGRLIGRTGRASRFPSSAAFANYAGAAPVEVPAPTRLDTASPPEWRPPAQRRAAHRRHDPDPNPRQPRPHLLQRQARRGQPLAKRDGACNDASPNHIWRTMITDARRQAASLGGHLGGNSAIQRGWPNHQLLDKSLPRPCQPRLHDGSASRLTSTEAPEGNQPSGPFARHVAYVTGELNDRAPERTRLRHPGSPLRHRNGGHTHTAGIAWDCPLNGGTGWSEIREESDHD